MNGDQDTLSRSGKERSSKRSVKSVKEKDVGKENIENKDDAGKREKILHRLEKIERAEKVIARNLYLPSFKIGILFLRGIIYDN